MSRRWTNISRIFLGAWLALSSFGAQPLSAAAAALGSASGTGAIGSISGQAGASLGAASLQALPLSGAFNSSLKLSVPSNSPSAQGFQLSVAPALSETAANASVHSAQITVSPTGITGSQVGTHADVVPTGLGLRQEGRIQPAKTEARGSILSSVGADSSTAENETAGGEKLAARGGLKKLSLDADLGDAHFDGREGKGSKEAAPTVAATGGALRRGLLRRAAPVLAAGAAVLAFPSVALAHGAHAAQEGAGAAPYDGLSLPTIAAAFLAFEGVVWLAKKAWSRWGASAAGLFHSAKKKAQAAIAKHDHDHEHEHEGVSARNMLIAIGITAAYMAVEFWGALAFNSLALKSDAVHMLWHTVALTLGAVGMILAYRHTKSKHEGESRGALWVALLNGGLLGVMAIAILGNAVLRLMDPVAIGGLQVTVIGAGGLLVNFIGAWLLRGGHENDANAEAMFWHNVGDIVGSLVAIAAGLAVMANPMLAWLDPLLSILVARWLIGTAWGIVAKNFRRLKEGKA